MRYNRYVLAGVLSKWGLSSVLLQTVTQDFRYLEKWCNKLLPPKVARSRLPSADKVTATATS